MNIHSQYDIEYDNPEKHLSIKVLSNQEKLIGVWFEKNEPVLVVNYDKKNQKFAKLEGSLGQQLQKTDLSEEIKIERVLEALNNSLWDYFHPKIKARPTIS